MLVRWLGAFQKKGSLHNSLQFELCEATSDSEVPCEKILNGTSRIHHAKIGLLIKNSAVIKTFNGDCWSVRRCNGKLQKTRNPKNAYSQHLEAWASPEYIGIVVKDVARIRKKSLKTVLFWAEEFKIPIMELKERESNVILHEIFL